jgi:hypothetical protein
VADTDLTVLIKTLLDSRGLDDLKTRLQDSAAKAQEAKSGAKDFSDAITSMGAKLLAATGLTLGMAEAVKFLQESFRAAVENERVLDQMTSANQLLAKATDQETEANKRWIDSVQMASGITKNELVPNYLRLLESTGDVEKAQRLLNIAAGASARGLGDLGQIVQALARYWLTGEAGTRGFGLAIKALNDEGVRGDAVFQTLEKRYGDAGASVDNAGKKVDRAKIAWEETKEAVGRLFLSLKDDLLPSVQAIGEAFGVIYFLIQTALVGLKQWAGFLPAFGRATAEFLSGHFEDAKRIMADQSKESERLFNEAMLKVRKFAEDLKGIYNDYKNDVKRGSGELTGSHEDEAKALAALKQKYEDELKAAQAASVSILGSLNAEIALYRRMAADPALGRSGQIDATLRLKKAEQALNDELERERKILASGRTLGDVLKAHQDELDAQRKEDEKYADDRFKLADQTFKKLHGADQDYLRQYVRFLADQLAAFKGSEDEKARLEAEYGRARIDLKKLEARQEMEIEFMLADAALGFMGSVFGKTKAYAIAQAIISTYEAASKALAWEPAGWWNFAAAGLVIATGLANVATIAETEPGGGAGGFDDPRNDFAARAGGQKWARDMIQFYGQGAAAGFSEGMMRGGGSSVSTVHNVTNSSGDRQVNVHFHGIMSADRVALMQFVKRDLTPVLNNLDKQRSLRN